MCDEEDNIVYDWNDDTVDTIYYFDTYLLNGYLYINYDSNNNYCKLL